MRQWLKVRSLKSNIEMMAVNSMLMTQMMTCHAQNQKIHIDTK